MEEVQSRCRGFEVISFKTFLESRPLGELQFEMAIRKEFDCTKEQAQELVDWSADRKDWDELDDETATLIIHRWDPRDFNDEFYGYGTIAQDLLKDLLKRQYKLNVEDLQ